MVSVKICIMLRHNC